METKDLIEHLHEWHENLISEMCADDVLTCDDLCGYPGPCIVIQAADLLEAQQKRIAELEAALREQEEREKPKPLTMDELMRMDGEPVWVVCDDLVLCALVEVCEESIFLTNNLGGRTEYADNEELEADGITAYRSKPKE